MNRILIIFLCFIVSFNFAQDKKEQPSLQSFQKRAKYIQNRKYDGPATSYRSPAPMEDKSEVPPSSLKPQGGKMDYSPEELQKLREQKYNQKYGKNGSGGSGQGSGQGNGGGKGNGGNRAGDPEMGKPEPLDFNPPEINPPDIDMPDINPWDMSGPSFSANLWKTILIVIASILLLFLIYYFVKNHRPRNKKVKGVFVPNEWNPEEITKTELELRLEKAMETGDYRECVRIYFTFILKELIRLKCIRWKKELTNFDYILQYKGKKGANDFEESVRIYDLIWYGEYEIGKQEFQKLEIHLKSNYNQLSKIDA